jgi:hypothetical protein
MSEPKISLCIITGNEEATIERFLSSFAPAFDELCIVRAIGNQVADRTLGIAKDFCRKHGKGCRIGEYFNTGDRKPETGNGSISQPSTLNSQLGPVDDSRPETWPHVDDFAAARNLSWSLATCPWQFWADVDDVLVPADGPLTKETQSGGAELIRLIAKLGRHDRALFTYDLRHQNEANARERLFRTGISRWTGPIHETCRVIGETNNGAERIEPGTPNAERSTPNAEVRKRIPTVIEKRVIFEHAPTAEKKSDPRRNRRILQWHMRHVDQYPYELMREWFYEWQAARANTGNRKPETGKDEILEAKAQAQRWGDIANQCELPGAQRFDLLLKQAALVAEEDVERAIELCWAAIRVDPKSRTGWGDLARYELRSKRAGRAALATEFMQVLPKKALDGNPVSGVYYGYAGAQLRAETLRAAGQEAAARKHEETIFAANGRRISLLHATRGRPAQAIATRDLWYRAAFCPLGVEHIFAIDHDDAASLEALKNYRHVVVGKPETGNRKPESVGHPDGGCVAAWNAAAAESSGHVLVQLSDDWIPCHDWDALIFEALEKATAARMIGTGPAMDPKLHPELVGATPLVLAVHDGARRDALLCMAILTRARYLAQVDGYPIDILKRPTPYLFSPEYFGVFSDNEFTVRAYDDGVVVQAQHIVFEHRHPVFGKAGMDATYARQNDPARYREGLEIFNRRNPKHAIRTGV